jgi:hypothetical protein
MRLDEWQRNVEQELRKINDELGELCERVARIETDLAWIKWFVIAIAGGMIAVLIRTFFG